jgi:tetratricopeptide (TPR) repeat protein
VTESIITHAASDVRASDAQVQQARKLFDQGRRAFAADSQRFAIHAFADAICHDPSQRQYAKELLALLSTTSIIGPGQMATAWHAWRLARQLAGAIDGQDWQTTLDISAKLLILRPRSKAALLGLGQACAALKCFDSAVVYLRYAHKLWPGDLLVNRHCGRMLGKVQQFDEAVGCWNLVRKRLPRDEEALRAIGNLAVKKTCGE